MKETVAVLFGGQSSEHDVSVVSGANIAGAIDTDKYDLLLIGITKEGRWLLCDSIADMKSGAWTKSTTGCVISPDATKKCAMITGEDGTLTERKIDVIFPALHGLYGEDGTVQGIFELAKIPYVGCGVLASAVCMDKLFTKIVVKDLGIRQARYIAVYREDLAVMPPILARIEEKLGYPVFVKPANAGSSCGISKACTREELIAALQLASQHDREILVEEMINGRELECAVLNGHASGVGEILAAADYYDYDAKYNNPDSKTVIGPKLPEGKEDEIRAKSEAIFKAVNGAGLARVDYFLENDTDSVIFNEINTLPGFTAISMYPMLWAAEGLPKQALVDRLIEDAKNCRRR